ncbi:TIGR00730 family Rossman fold protein [Streptomyces prunicolor]|uniref:LOG family protein n=1 Tax=Streptomyces prunicolor TaxID=67348 RepID=UPI0037D3EC89
MNALVHSVTVFCGASPGRGPAYLRAATALGRAVAGAGLRLVYGGAALGLMGAVADGALEAGGTVIGVIPENFPREIAHLDLTELHVVPDMHRRKALMGELGDAFVALPGGLGTAEELFEVLTWAQIHLHSKPCVLLNQDGYYRPLLDYLRHAAHEGFLSPTDTERLVVCDDASQVVRFLTALPAVS